MAGALRKTMVYLGLAEEDERYDAYDDYEDYDKEPARAERPRAR
jgi:cell division inhibitor SepF